MVIRDAEYNWSRSEITMLGLSEKSNKLPPSILRLYSPVIEEGLLIAIAVALILGVIVIIFAVFDWLESTGTLWNQF